MFTIRIIPHNYLLGFPEGVMKIRDWYKTGNYRVIFTCMQVNPRSKTILEIRSPHNSTLGWELLILKNALGLGLHLYNTHTHWGAPPLPSHSFSQLFLSFPSHSYKDPQRNLPLYMPKCGFFIPFLLCSTLNMIFSVTDSKYLA